MRVTAARSVGFVDQALCVFRVLVGNMIEELIIKVRGEAVLYIYICTKKHPSRFAYPKCQDEIYLQEIQIMTLSKTSLNRVSAIHLGGKAVKKVNTRTNK